MTLALRDVPRDNRDLMRYLQPLIWSWGAVAGKGIPFTNTTVSSVTKYSGDFANAGAGGLALRAVGGANQFIVNAAGITATGIITGTNFPIGEVRWTASSTVPTGFLACDGASYLRASYPALFIAIGTQWGAADGTHFNVPNLVGKFPIGAGTAGWGTFTLGASGGAATYTLAHTHASQAHDHPVSHTHPGSHGHGLAAHRHQMGHDHTVDNTHDHGGITDGPSSTTNRGSSSADVATSFHWHAIASYHLNVTSSNSNNTVTGDGEKTSGGSVFTSTDQDTNAPAASISNVGAANYSGSPTSGGSATQSVMNPYAVLTAMIWAGV